MVRGSSPIFVSQKMGEVRRGWGGLCGWLFCEWGCPYGCRGIDHETHERHEKMILEHTPTRPLHKDTPTRLPRHLDWLGAGPSTCSLDRLSPNGDLGQALSAECASQGSMGEGVKKPLTTKYTKK